MSAGEPFCLLCGNRSCTCQKVFLGGYDIPNINAHVTINGESFGSDKTELILSRLSSIEQLLRTISWQLSRIDGFQRGDN